MAKKRAKEVNAVQEEKSLKSVRLELARADHERLERCARAKGLNMASYSRMAVLEMIRADEARER